MKVTKENVIEVLCQFVNQRPGMEPMNYGNWREYRRESAEVTRDRDDFYKLMSVAQRRLTTEQLSEAIYKELANTSGRLRINESGELEYCTGQYFPVEFRPAACRVLVSVIWDNYRDELTSTGEKVYKDGNELWKAIRRNFGRRINKNYFR